jgi:hypothetical protein
MIAVRLGPWPRTFSKALGAAALVVMLAACGDDGPSAPQVLDLQEVQGLYEVASVTFDPQGAAPAADVLAALEEGGVSPTLNIGQTGNFQLFYRDPVEGDIRTLSGTVTARADGVDLVFASQAEADQFLFPARLVLDHDAEAEMLSFSGSASVNRVRLQQLFPELYGEEPWTSQTIPGILTVVFQRTE